MAPPSIRHHKLQLSVWGQLGTIPTIRSWQGEAPVTTITFGLVEAAITRSPKIPSMQKLRTGLDTVTPNLQRWNYISQQVLSFIPAPGPYSPPTPRLTLRESLSARKSAVSLNTATGGAWGTVAKIEAIITTLCRHRGTTHWSVHLHLHRLNVRGGDTGSQSEG